MLSFASVLGSGDGVCGCLDGLVCLVDLNVVVCVFGCLIDLVRGLFRLVGCLLVMIVGWC